MTVTIVKPTIEHNLTLDEFLSNPPEHQEWINGNLEETNAVTIKHSEIQAKLIIEWGTFLKTSKQGGKVYAELPCRTNSQGRRPDVAYLTADLVSQYDDIPSLPQSPPLIAEIASPADSAEDLFAKATEYLSSGCEEVWLVLPENKRVFIIISEQTLVFSDNDVIETKKVLKDFSITINDLFS